MTPATVHFSLIRLATAQRATHQVIAVILLGVNDHLPAHKPESLQLIVMHPCCHMCVCVRAQGPAWNICSGHAYSRLSALQEIDSVREADMKTPVIPSVVHQFDTPSNVDHFTNHDLNPFLASIEEKLYTV